MKIKIGDHVRFLNDTGEGKVVKLMSDRLVEVRTADGWDMPYPVDELIVLPDEDGGDAYKPEPATVNLGTAKESSAFGMKNDLVISSDIFLLIVQDTENKQFSGVRFYLVNDTQQQLDFIYYRIGLLSTVISESDSLEPGTKIFLDELNLEALSSMKGWQIQGILSNPEQKFISPIINNYIPFQTKKFASQGAYSENDFLHEAAMLIQLTPDPKDLLDQSLDSVDIGQIVMQKENDNIELNKPRVFHTSKPDQSPREIDLHINRLVDKVIGLSNREILGIQMDKFHEELKHALTLKESSIVFIHGIGNGTLKKELRKTIERDYDVCEYEDASFKEYGFGATLLRIRQNK